MDSWWKKKLGGLDGIDSSLKNVEYAFSFGEAGKEFKEYLTKKGIKSICFNKLESVLLAAVKKALNGKRKYQYYLFTSLLIF